MGNTETNSDLETTTIHPWEAVGLGRAPYRIIGNRVSVYRPCPDSVFATGNDSRPGTSCDYCGQGIKYVVEIKAACGSTFKVGCDCAMKVNSKGTRLYSKVQRLLLDAKNAARKASTELRVSAAYDALQTDEVQDVLQAIPHPNMYRAEQGDTLLSWAMWMLDHAGASGSLKVVRRINKECGTKI